MEENDKKKKDLMSKLHELNRKYSPSKSQTEPEKSANAQMKRDFLYDSPSSQLRNEEKRLAKSLKSSETNNYKPSSKGTSGRYDNLVESTMVMDKIKNLEKELIFIQKKLETKESQDFNEENEIDECSNLVLRTISNLEDKNNQNNKSEMIDSLVKLRYNSQQEALEKVQEEFKQKFMDIANSLQQIHMENEEVVGTSFSCIEKLTSDLEVVSNTCHSALSNIHQNLDKLSKVQDKKPSKEIASKGKMSFGVNSSSNLVNLRKELEQKEAEASELRNQLSESESEAKEKLSEIKKEIDNQDEKIKECMAFP